MATRQLRPLIEASGYGATGGQSFRNHVLGAAVGAFMSFYELFGWTNWASSDYSSSTLYPSGSVIHFTFDFTANSYWTQIRRPASEMQAAMESDTNADASLSVVYGAGTSGNSAAVTLLGVQITNPSGMSIYKNYFTDFNGTNATNGEPPPDNNDYQWEIDPEATYPATNVYDLHTLTLTYPGEGGLDGAFNDPLTQSYSVQVGRRLNPAALEYEWHANSTYTSLVSTNAQLTFMAGASNYTGDFWLRYRVVGNSTWTNYGQVHWYDPRFTNH